MHSSRGRAPGARTVGAPPAELLIYFCSHPPCCRAFVPVATDGRTSATSDTTPVLWQAARRCCLWRNRLRARSVSTIYVNPPLERMLTMRRTVAFVTGLYLGSVYDNYKRVKTLERENDPSQSEAA